MKTNLLKKQKGFTIIEVLIVLAIAALILLIVFLAVPALQRNNRNTQRSNDVAAILGAVSEHATNNNGALPTTAAEITDITQLGYYDEGAGITLDIGGAAVTNDTSTDGSGTGDEVIVVTAAQCNGPDSAPGPARGTVALYSKESSVPAGQQVCQAT